MIQDTKNNNKPIKKQFVIQKTPTTPKRIRSFQKLVTKSPDKFSKICSSSFQIVFKKRSERESGSKRKNHNESQDQS